MDAMKAKLLLACFCFGVLLISWGFVVSSNNDKVEDTINSSEEHRLLNQAIKDNYFAEKLPPFRKAGSR